jgi:hypothetical protein
MCCKREQMCACLITASRRNDAQTDQLSYHTMRELSSSFDQHCSIRIAACKLGHANPWLPSTSWRELTGSSEATSPAQPPVIQQYTPPVGSHCVLIFLHAVRCRILTIALLMSTYSAIRPS